MRPLAVELGCALQQHHGHHPTSRKEATGWGSLGFRLYLPGAKGDLQYFEWRSQRGQPWEEDKWAKSPRLTNQTCSAARCWSEARPPCPCRNVALAQGQDTVRIGVPTKTYWPTIICETAIRQKLFEKEGIKAELTIYRSGAEGFEAIAAGAADLDPQLLLQRRRRPAEGRQRQVRRQRRQRLLRLVSGGEDAIRPSRRSPSSPARRSASRPPAPAPTSCARWTLAEHKIDFTRVPLGGGGLVPNLLTGNIDATVLYSPLTYKVIDEKVARPLIDYGAEVPAAFRPAAGSPATRSSRSGRRSCRRRSTPSTAGLPS